ncbi:ComEA family DNA-binding protein [Gryllotalpicola reticulitermitis]|uniref:ComEA family DNA-binding protein n=1 Tax=Gryllotalpicola reticulitermitis TaxID=1184153 RepID=A0ABV8QA37_9MICO
MTETAPSSDESDDALAPSAKATSRVRIGLGAAVVLFVIGIGVAVVSGLLNSGGGLEPVTADGSAGSAAITAAPSPIASRSLVHVLGQVARPGVYELAAGARVIDAVGAAGGFAAAADRTALNLAQRVADGEQIYVPKPGEAPPVAAVGGVGASGGGAVASGDKLDLNSATLEQLETLPRVGPSLGQRILDWRTQNGRFSSVDDLQNVSGIGEKTFADLKDLVTAG